MFRSFVYKRMRQHYPWGQGDDCRMLTEKEARGQLKESLSHITVRCVTGGCLPACVVLIEMAAGQQA